MTTPNCAQVRSLLMPYLDSELDAATTVAVTEHLQRCPTCRARFDAEQQIESALVEHLEQGSMPPDVWERLEDRLARSAPRRTSWPLLAAAAALLVAVAFLFVDRSLDTFGGRLLVRLVSVHNVMGEAPSPALKSRGEVQELLESLRYTDLDLPSDGRKPSHTLTLLGASEQVIEGVRAVHIVFDCCSVTTSVIVVRRDALEALPEALQPGAVSTRPLEQAVDGVLTSTFARDAYYFTVLSRHSTAVAGHWAS